MKRLRRAVLGAVIATNFACNVLNRLDVCPRNAADARINERGDQDEFIGHPRAAAALDNGRVLIAFLAQTYDDFGNLAASEVRIALADIATGERLTVCETTARDRTISEPGTVAYGASVAPVNLTIAQRRASALVAWTEGIASPRIRMRFFDGAACPRDVSFFPFTAGSQASSLTWSDNRHAVLATTQDGRNVYRSWIDSTGPAPMSQIATGSGLVLGGFPISALAPDGSSMVVWTDNGEPWGVLLDADGNPRPAVAAGGQATSFAIDIPPSAGVRLDTVSVSAGENRFAVADERTTSGIDAIARVFAREYSLDGAPQGSVYPLDAEDSGAQSSPS